jgi:type VI secretion system FHA domain protein
MVLTLEIRGALAEKLGPLARKVFSAAGGSIGRLPDNYWALPDPYISGRHAIIKYVNGAFYIEDTSTNGVSINSQDNRLTKGQPYAIRSGDWIFIEPYEIKASISEQIESPSSPFIHESTTSGAELDPLALLDPDPRAAPKPSPKASELARKPVVSEHYTPPRPVIPESAPVPGAARPLIPDNYDPFGDQLVSDDHSGLPSASLSAPLRNAHVPPLEAEWPISHESAARPELHDAHSSKQVSGETSRAANAIDLRQVLVGAGLGDVEVSPELLKDFGEILRVVVGGLMDVLQARQRLKSEFRMGMTTFKPTDNNPLKFSANVDDALHNLLVKRNAAYLGPVDAFEDAFEDVKNHQMAMLAGVRVAFESMLAEFDPDRLQPDFDRQLKKGALLSAPAKLRYWELYREKFHDMVRDVESTFRELFGEEFARAYEEQLKRLKTQERVHKP